MKRELNDGLKSFHRLVSSEEQKDIRVRLPRQTGERCSQSYFLHPNLELPLKWMTRQGI